ncbi:MAG TPA: helix-turn-helix domain-containing protein [Pseudonocardiaceae bacterium]|jgi:transcriptional regulator GlxA family with amidase domain|nr:helix-turn-helix domain-containing protein [Pseudonocardiaceae bacterium]
MAIMCNDLAMRAFAGDGRHRVAVLVRDGVLPMELGLVHQIFGQARSARGQSLYEVVSCGLAPGAIRTDADFAIVVDAGAGALAEADTVIVPASHESDESAAPLPDELERALGRVRPKARIASICTGAFVLAAAGILDGRRATTHWLSAERFRRRFPAVELDPDVLYVDEGRVLTSAGEASGIDLCLHIVRQDHGVAVANDVARRTVVSPHREGGQAQFIAHPVPAPQLSSTTGPTRVWILENLEKKLALTELAEHASVSIRTFNRKFREEVGLTPVEWITQQRIARARRLLEESDLTVEQIATRTGYHSSAGLRQHFVRAVGLSPGAYRTAFRAP